MGDLHRKPTEGLEVSVCGELFTDPWTADFQHVGLVQEL